MCRATTTCSEMPGGPDSWSRVWPLPPPTFFEEEVEKFAVCLRIAAAGDVLGARASLSLVRGDALREWCVVHGQNSGVFRNRHFRIAADRRDRVVPGSPPSHLIEATDARDHFQCRYCGLRVLPIGVLRAFEAVVGSLFFASAAKNASHGAALVFRATYDHVVPTSCGGQHALDNLVTACYPCNFGKAGYTLSQLGLDDPRARPLPPGNWDGLISLLPALRSVSRRSAQPEVPSCPPV